MPADGLYSEEMDFSNYKHTCAYKYQKRFREKKQSVQTKKNNNVAQYDDLVSEIKTMRIKHKDVSKLVTKLEKIKKQKKRYKNIAQTMNSTYIEKYGVPLLDVVNSLIESAKLMREMIGEDVLKFLLDLFTTLYNIYKNPEWKGVVLNMTNFFVKHFKQDHADLALTWFKVAFEVATTQDDKEFAWDQYILSFFTAAEDFLSDQIWERISEFWEKICILYASTVTLVSIETIDFPTVWKEFSKFKKTAPAVKDIISSAFQAYEFITGNWEHIVSGNWSEFALGKDESKIFELEVRELEQAFTMVIANQEIELMDNYKMNPSQYEQRLEKALKHAKSLISRATSVQQRMSISNFIKSLGSKQAELWARRADAPTKEESWALKLSGPSSCGKSTMINLMAKTILHAYGRDPKQRGQVVFTNIDEKHESTIKPSHKIIVADDVANNLNVKPNYDRVLNYVNTVPRPLDKAEAHEKGILYPGNDALIASTNDITLRATKSSTCPESILRRFALDVVVTIKGEFRNEYGGLIKQDKMRFDVYDLTLQRFSHIEPEDRTDPENFRPSEIIWDVVPRWEWNPNDTGSNDFSALCAFIAKDVARHRIRQKNQMAMQKEIDDGGFCKICHCPEVICACIPDDLSSLSVYEEDEEEISILADEQFVEESSQTDEILSDPDGSIASVQVGLGTYWSTMSTAELWDTRAFLANFGNFSKNCYKTTRLYQKMYNDKNVYLQGIAGIVFAAMFSTIIGSKVTQTIAFSTLSFLAFKYQKTIQAIDEEINRRSDRLSSLCEDVTTHLQNHSKKYFALSGAIFAMYGFYKVFRPLIYTQDKSTYLDQTCSYFDRALDCPPPGKFKFDIQDERDYKEGYSRLAPKESGISKTTVGRDLHLSIAKALRVVVVKSRGQNYGTVNGIMIASNVIMVPAHVVPYTFPFDIETTTTPNVPCAKTKDQKLTEEYCYIDRESDHAFIHLASSPASANFAQFFSEEYPTFYGRSTTVLWKSPSGEVKTSVQVARPTEADQLYQGYLEKPGKWWGESPQLTTLNLKKGTGLTANLEFNGFGGLCGGIWADTTKGIIYGFHVAGFSGTAKGFATCVLKTQIDTAIAALKETSPTMIVHSSGEVKVDTYGTPYTLVNEKPLYTRDDGCKEATIVTYLGKVLKDNLPMESRARPPYMKTPFIQIEENLGARTHRPPTKPNDVAKGMKTLNKLHNPVQHYEGDILLKAINDYKEHTLAAVRADKEELKDVLRIYSQEEAMDGIGQFGLGGMPNDTSAGFPINKSKKHCLKRDPMDESLVQIPREFNDAFDIQSEVDRTMHCWKNGERSESIYKSSSKVNELLPDAKAKDKVRKFYGSSFANFVASRRALAGIPQFMKKYWQFTECLVGINALSREWSEFHDYLTAYSTTNMIAGDFSGFDTRMAAQITGAAAEIMLSWYKEVGCSEDDIEILRGALSDIIHPNILFDGDLYRFANGNPSGNLITVQLNSICNSLMMRYVYYAMMPTIKEKFADNVRLGTYGDDNAMSVKHHCKWYTHTACQAEFEKLDIGYTMAQKDAASRPYIPIEEISFLKRNFVLHKELKIIVGPIEEDSSLKRFHYVKKPNECPLTAEEQFGCYTDGAFRDYYIRGREAYDSFITKMKNIVSVNQTLSGFVAFIPYDEMTQILKHDYSIDYKSTDLPMKLFMESMGVSEDDLSMLF